MKAKFITFVRGLKNGTPPRFQSYLKSLTLLLVVVMSVNMWGAEKTIKFTPDATTTGSSATSYGTVNCTISEIGWTFNQYNPNNRQVKTNQSSAGNEFNFKNTSALPGKIKSVVITFQALSVSDASKLCFIGGSSAISSLSGGSAGTWNSTAKTLTWEPASTTNYTYFAFYQNGKAASGTNLLAESDAIVITYEAAATEKYTVTIKDGSDNTLNTLTESAAGAGVTLPNQTTTCEDWTFLGYSETKFASETQDPATEPTIIDKGSYKPTKNITLYPVFKKTESTGGASASYQITFAKGDNDSGTAAPEIQSGSDYATLSSTTKAYKRTNGMHLSSGKDAGNATLTLTNAGKVKASSIVTNALAKDNKSFKITVTYTDETTAEKSFTPGTTSVNNTIDLDNTKTISTIYYSANSGTGTGIASTTVNYTNSVTHNFYITTPSCAAPRVLDYIEVTGTPAEFWKGDEFNHTGMTVKAYYTEGDPDDVTGSATYSGYDMSVAGEQTVTVTYKSKTDTYEIDVKTIANTAETAYTTAKAIEIIDAGKDLATQVYVTGTVSKVNGYYSNKYITYFLDEDAFEIYNGLGKEGAAFSSQDDIQVDDEVVVYGQLTKFGSTYELAADNQLVSLTRPKKLTSITVSGTPDYFDTQSSFNHNGMTVTAHYNTGASDDADVTASAVFTAPDMTTQGEKTVNVSYTENEITKETSYKIQVAQYCANVVTITKGDEENGTFSLSQTGNICADGGLTISVTNIVPAEHYHFKQITATNGDVDDNAKTVSNITANTTINVEFEEDEKVTVKWHVGTAAPVETADVYVGTAFADVKANAPTVADNAAGDCANKFMGWATSAITAQDGVDEDDVAWATEPISNENKEFYAVWAKVTGSTSSDPAVTFDFTDAGWGFPSENTTTEETYTNNDYSVTINAAAGHKIATQQKSGGVYEQVAILFGKNGATMKLPNFGFPVSKIVCVKSPTGGTSVHFNVYSGETAVSTEVTGCKDNDQTFIISESYQSSPLTIKVVSNHNVQIAGLKIYAGASYSNYITSCFIPTYSVTILSNNTTMGTAAIKPEHIKDVYEQGDELEVNATVTESELYRFVNWTIEPATTGASLHMGANEAENLLTVGSGNITLTANFEEIPAEPITVTLVVGEHGTLDCDDCEENTITEEKAGEGVLVPNVIANEGWAFLGWSTSSTATEPEYEVADIFYPSDDNKTLYAVYAQLYKVTLKYTDEVKWQTTTGGAITLPSRDCKNETYKGHFAGWSITEFAEETTNPTETPTIYPVGDFVPTADITLYPVFSITAETTQWVKTTGDKVTEGVYAILCSSEKAFNGSTTSGHGGTTTDAFVFDANNIATSVPTGICEITMQPYKNAQGTVLGYKMYNADKGYLYAKEAKSGSLAWQTTENSDWCWASSNWKYYSHSAYLRSYSGTAFRTYGNNSGDGPVHFAKKETASVGKYWSKPANDVINPELDLAAGDYLAPQTIKITAVTYQSDYKYYYTTNGNEPDKTSTEYDHNTGIQLEIANNYTVKVIGYDEDGFSSQIVSAEYTIWATYSTLAEMYAGFQNGKPVGLTLTDAYIHKVYTPGGGTTKQLFVQEKNSTLGVVLSGNTSDFGEDFNSGIEGKTISFTVTGEYALGNERQQIGKVKFTNYTINDVVTRPTAEEYATATIAANLIGLTKLDNVYAIAKDGNVVTVNTQSDGLGDSYKVYNIFNVVKTIPESTIACNVKGLFNVRDGQQYIMPVLATDFDVVEKQDAQLPTVNPAGGASEGEALPVANEEIITITPAAGFTTSYRMNGAEWIPITTQYVQPTIVEENTTLEVKATRPYYNDASATYFYHIDAGLTKYPITLPSPQTYVKTETDLASAKAGDKVTITISQKVARYWETSVTVVKTDEESVTTDVTSEGNHVYSFIMPAYPVTVKVNYADAPKVDINYNKGDGTGIEGEMPQEHAYIGDEYQLSDCAFHAAGLTFTGWKAYKTGDKETPVAINDNKIIVPDYNVSVEAQWDMAPWKKEGTWELVTKTSELGVGDYVIFTETIYAGTETARQAGTSTVKGAGKNLATTTNISISSNKLSRLNNDGSMVFQVETGNVENTYAFYADGIGYLNANGTSTNNYMITTESKESTNASWAVESIDATTGEAVVKAKSENRNMMQVNVSNSIFAAYGSKQGGLAIYKFYPKAWTVTFDDNVEDEEIAVPEMQRADPTTNKVTISDMIPVRTGYDFSIWNSAKGGTGVTSANPTDEITLSANTTLYAQWNIKQYNVAVAEVENVTIQAKPYSEEVIAEGGNANVNFKKSVVLSYSDLHEDYVFKSWKVTKADDETTVVPVSVGSSTTFEVPAYAVTVSAIIESKATTQLTVTYHANGGKNKTAGDPEEVSEQVNWNTTIKFAEHPCPFEKNLCTFAGWNTKADGTGTTYKTQVTVKSDIDLYAMWEASAVEYVIDDNVEAKVKVQEGVAPTGSAATFVTTYMGTFGQLTNTHKGTLTLTGYAGKVITGVKMQMRSNGSSGAGTIVIKVGDKEICSTSYAESFGSHSSSYSVAELANFNAAIIGETENITIVVSCTDNSLYIKGYTIEYTDPEIIRNELAVDQYTTFCWPKTIPANAYTGATFWNIESKTTMADGRLSSITIVQHEGDLEAGVPYIMYNTATEFKCYQTGEAVDAPAAEGNNGLVGVFEITMFDTKIRPVTDDADAAARGIYIISDGTLYLCGNNCGVYANRAYIVNGNITDQSAKAPAHAARRTIGNPNGTPTNLNGLNGNVKAQKALIDGHIYIIRDNKMYNAQGLFVK